MTPELKINFNKPFAIIRRKDEGEVLVLECSAAALDKLSDIPRPSGQSPAGEMIDSVSAIPFSQIKERGFKARDDGAKILCLQVERQQRVALGDLLAILPEEKITLEGGISYNYSEAEYERVIKAVVEKEIGNGEGANFVIPRKGEAKIQNMSMAKALSMYKNLLRHEMGSYWNFIFYNGERYLLGATPERHISIKNGRVKMNPISGTLRKPEGKADSAAFRKELMAFLADEKEINELFMVVDEELKMMAKLCAAGGMIVGPLLKEMANVIHTEYLLSGKSDMDAIELLRGSMYAATVTGSPLENACNIIYKYEPEARRYYAGALALLGRDAAGQETLDSPILIRFLEISQDGRVLTRVGSTLVRDSIPGEEVAETKAKIKSLLAAVQNSPASAPVPLLPFFENDDEIQELLQQRNQALSKFWFFNQEYEDMIVPELRGKKIIIIDNEDDFCHMTKHMLGRMGAVVDVVRFTDFNLPAAQADIVIVGPGPGDPNDAENAKMVKVGVIVEELLASQKKFVGICLGHQILCRALGLPVEKKDNAFQGVPETIDFFGKKERVGFYNTFVGKYKKDVPGVDIAYDAASRDIHALRSKNFVSFQFHPESILTQHGYDILRETLIALCTGK